MQAGRNSPTANPNQHTEEELEFIRDIAGGVLHQGCQIVRIQDGRIVSDEANVPAK